MGNESQTEGWEKPDFAVGKEKVQQINTFALLTLGRLSMST
jgi:hypothetical protein